MKMHLQSSTQASQLVADVHLVDAVVQLKTSAVSILATLVTHAAAVVAVDSEDCSLAVAIFVAWHC